MIHTSPALKTLALSLGIVLMLCMASIGAPQSAHAAGAGASCVTNDDCDDALACISNKCAADTSLDAPAGAKPAGAACHTDDDCADALACISSICAVEGTSVATPAASAATTNTASDAFVPLTSFPGFVSAGNAATLPGFLSQLYKMSIGVAAVLAVLMIMYSGFLFMTNKGSISSNENAKKYLQNAILGLVLVLSPAVVFGIIDQAGGGGQSRILNLDFTSDIQSLNTGALDKADTSLTTATTNGASAKCSTYGQVRPVRSDDGSNRCDADEVVADTTCCNLSATNQICCAKKATTTYLLAFYITDTQLGKACLTTGKQQFADLPTCQTQMNAASGLAGTKPITFLKSCEVVTNTDFTFPTQDTPYCK